MPGKTPTKFPVITPLAAAIAALAMTTTAVFADANVGTGIATAPLKPDMPYVFVVNQGRSIKVQRSIQNSFKLPPGVHGVLNVTSEYCPPFCLQPLQLDMPVETVGEVEVVDFMATTLRDNKGLLVDVRGPKDHAYSTIPASVNYPAPVFKKSVGDPAFDAMLESLGAKRRGEVSQFTRLLEDWGLSDTTGLSQDWDFTNARELIIWSTGATSRVSPDAIRALLAVGYPAQKIRWYRGGMAAWAFWGFTIVPGKPFSPSAVRRGPG